MKKLSFRTLGCLCILLLVAGCSVQSEAPPESGPVYRLQEAFVDAGGVLIYTRTLGSGKPLVVLHGGPGASHDYFLPYLLPLARTHRLIFIDERGSRALGEAGGSGRLHGRGDGGGRGSRPDRLRSRPDRSPGPLLRRRPGAGLRAEVPAEPGAPRPVQHVPQHGEDERGVPADEGEDGAGAAGPDREDGGGGSLRPGEGVRAEPLLRGLHGRGLGRGVFSLPVPEPPRSQLRPDVRGDVVGPLPCDVGLERRVRHRREPLLGGIRGTPLRDSGSRRSSPSGTTTSATRRCRGRCRP